MTASHCISANPQLIVLEIAFLVGSVNRDVPGVTLYAEDWNYFEPNDADIALIKTTTHITISSLVDWVFIPSKAQANEAFHFQEGVSHTT